MLKTRTLPYTSTRGPMQTCPLHTHPRANLVGSASLRRGVPATLPLPGRLHSNSPFAASCMARIYTSDVESGYPSLVFHPCQVFHPRRVFGLFFLTMGGSYESPSYDSFLRVVSCIVSRRVRPGFPGWPARLRQRCRRCCDSRRCRDFDE